MKIISLDLGTKTGFAVYEDGNLIDSGVVNLSAKKKEHKSERFIKYKTFIESLTVQHSPDIIIYEQVRRHIGTAAAHVYGGFLALTHILCLQKDIPFEGLEVKFVKKAATGNGNANKKLMIETAKKKYPNQHIKDDNQADAILIGSVYIEKEK